ncbi:MAG: LPS assembly protein LptD, partial [Planctomycetota bacterium]
IADRRAKVAGPGLRVPEAEGITPQEIIRKQRRRARIAEEQRRLYELPVGEALAQTPPVESSGNQAPREDVSILPARGAVVYAMDRWSAKFDDDQTTVSLLGDVRLVFEDYAAGRVVTLRAQRVVLFIKSDREDEVQKNISGGGGTLDAGGLAGVYLEENAIISDGSYTVRAPRVYYDLARDRATLLDAVFYTYDAERQVPLYVRADTVRQSSANDFVAENAQLTTSEFAVPHFSIGAGELKVSRYATAAGEADQFIEARDTSLNVGATPVFVWPYLAGRGRQTPLRRLDVGFSSDNGAVVETTWDLFAMLGKPSPDNLDARAQIDYLGDHGLGLGVNGEYETRDSFGSFAGYFLPDDSGEDDIGGRSVDQQDEQRGTVLTRNRTYLPNNFELSVEGAYVSDPTFLEEFSGDQDATGKQYETSAYLKWQSGDAAFDALATTNLSGFVEQLDTLQAVGYAVERYPEITGRVIGGELLGGQLTWYSQNSFSQLRILPGDDAPEDRGFDDAQSQAFFGIDAEVSFSERADALGLPTQSVRRFDTRQELALPLASGPIDVTPYIVGRVTAYDEDFADFNASNDDQVRFWGEAGVRLGTQLSKTDGDVNSALLDLNGIRHVIEPNFTFFLNGSTLDPNDLPIYDRDVEDLAEGVGAKFGFTNTWQTRRGGPGRERTVDWITLQTDFVF